MVYGYVYFSLVRDLIQIIYLEKNTFISGIPD